MAPAPHTRPRDWVVQPLVTWLRMGQRGHWAAERQALRVSSPSRWFLGFDADMSLARTINHIRNGGFAKYWRDMQYIGDAKWGRMVGLDRYVDAHGNETDAAQQWQRILGKL